MIEEIRRFVTFFTAVNQFINLSIQIHSLVSTSSGSSSRVRGAEKHEIYAAAFSGHLFYDLFSQGQGGHGPLGPPWIRYCSTHIVCERLSAMQDLARLPEFLAHFGQNTLSCLSPPNDLCRGTWCMETNHCIPHGYHLV